MKFHWRFRAGNGRSLFGRIGRGLAAIAIGVALIAFGLRQARRQSDSRNWPTVTGVVTESTVSLEGGREKSSGRFEYAYQVGGASHTGSSINLTGAGADLAEFPAGSTCTVYYNPANPADACLKPGGPATVWLFPALGLASVLGGIAALLGKGQG